MFDILKNCILDPWTFLYKMNVLKKWFFLPKKWFFCPKNAFFRQKWQFDPLHRAAPRQWQRTLFLECNFTPIFDAKKLGSVGQKCPVHFSSLQFSPKSAIFGGFGKKGFQKWLEPKTCCACYPNTLSYMVLDHLWVKNAIILAKNYNFPFVKNSHFYLFYGVLEVKLKFQDKF